MNKELIHGVLIDSVKTGDSNLVLTFFSEELGKFSCFAKGAASIKSRRKHHLEILNYLEFYIQTKGKTGKLDLPFLLDINSSRKLIKINNTDNQLKQSYSFAIFIIAEIIKKLLPDEEIEMNIFKKLISLKDTSQINSDVELNLLISYLSIQLLENLGYIFDITSYSEHISELSESLSEYILIANVNEPALKIEARSYNLLEYEILIPWQIIKIQKFMIQENNSWENVRRLNLNAKTANSLIELHLNWIESIIESQLKTKKYLDFVKIKP